ncbi:Anthocyanin 5-aromatic acyltransferase [Quillaja saponaria]|uniref:Anthocyanin 5-aromatic acyltransferase n=1 Tax=Quillaja saponaria TaxID=32244 RepID=A0AAD7LM19_QUISA|nr:Anthocyanin 5-aromatic acyltransferase [Quillaja saponaria]
MSNNEDDDHLGAFKLKVIDHFQVSPPQGSVPTSSLPLSFFDFPFLVSSQTRRIFFYEFPYSTNHFLETVIPCLKQSLSLSLQHFFPFAANLVFPTKPKKPHIHYVDDATSSSIPFTVAESTLDFNHLVADYSRDISDIYPLVPKMPPALALEDDTLLFPLMAIQVTVMSNSGFAIGTNFHHIVGDGMAFHHFMKTWASASNRLIRKKAPSESREVEEEEEGIHNSLPIFNDGSMVQDPNGVELCFLNHWWNWGPKVLLMVGSARAGQHLTIDLLEVKATFKLDKNHIDKLKHWISHKSQEAKEKEELASLRLSTFVVTCALIWICLAKSEQNTNMENEDEELYHFGFLANCRSRYEFLSIPWTYFGNCVAPGYVTLKRRKLVGENGIVEAAKAIRNKVKELEKDGVLRGAERWLLEGMEKAKSKHHFVIAGSPKLSVYETDFGWGKPIKSEVIHDRGSVSISLSDCREKNSGGIEVGVGLGRDQMNHFAEIWEQSLRML